MSDKPLVRLMRAQVTKVGNERVVITSTAGKQRIMIDSTNNYSVC